MRRVFANVPLLHRALLVSLVLVIGPTVVAVWAARTITAEDPPKWMTDQKAMIEAIDHDNALAEKDLLKPRARGEFGPFLLVAPGDANEDAGQSAKIEHCDVRDAYGVGVEWESLGLAQVLSSPLAIPELSTDSLVAGSCDGVVTMVTGSWLMPNGYGGDDTADISIIAPSHLPFRVEWQAAVDRTELTKIGGYQAVVERPIPGLITNPARLAYILFAEPKDDSLPIVVRVMAPSVEKSAQAVISSLEKRIAEMGLPLNPYN